MRTQRQVSRALSAFAFLAIAGGVAACGPKRRSDASPPAYIYFTNGSQDQASVYAVSGSQRVRIGTVFSNRTDTLVVPAAIAARGTNVRVVAELLARPGAMSTGSLAIHPGDRLSVRLSPNMSTLAVLPGAP